jgi:hypothetical protein
MFGQASRLVRGDGAAVKCVHSAHSALLNRAMEVMKHPESGGAEHAQTWFGSIAAVPFA